MTLERVTQVLPGIPFVESPLFYQALDEAEFSHQERQAAIDLHERGYAVIDFPDDELDERIERIKARLGPRYGIDLNDELAVKNTGENQRIQDAWLFDPDVKAIAANPKILEMLRKLYGRTAFPFQTLNFPVGTQQHLHSDSNHFSSLPERFMCGVWLAMEDVHPDAGPLTYLPGSHKWPIITNVMIGRRAFGAQPQSAQAPFEAAWDAMIAGSGVEQDVFLARKGQALIWAANLLHGGSPQINPAKTRWSQVSHYYFEDCIYYTPAFSDEPVGRLDLRTVTNVATGEPVPNTYLGREYSAEREDAERSGRTGGSWWRRVSALRRSDLPADFDAEAYLHLNPDVEVAGSDPAEHYLTHGAREGRRFRRG
jgi:ectoine hydroxylase-related dioxygenase (phytanoyl-CoA dioxygenase family)